MTDSLSVSMITPRQIYLVEGGASLDRLIGNPAVSKNHPTNS